MPDKLEKPEEYHIPYPPRDVFEYGGTLVDQVISEPQYLNIIEKIEYPDSGGMFIYHRNSLHPVKGFPIPEAIASINLVKRFFIIQVLTVIKTDLKYFIIPMLLLPFKRKVKFFNKWINGFSGLSEKILQPYFLKENRMTPIGREIKFIIRRMIEELGVDSPWIVSKVFASMIDYDSAYRYRIEDLMSETTKEKILQKPITEIRRLIKILAERDSRIGLNTKFKSVGIMLSVILLSPRIRNIFRKVISECEFNNLQPDEADRYHVLKLDGYKFLGRTIEDRWQEYVKLHNGNPPILYKYQDGKVIQ